jgi:CheY-like chemotaxis protein
MSENSNTTILVVDDVMPNRKLLNALLARQGYQVVEAENGQQALDVVKTQPIDLIFMDIMMPVMDGYEATRVIKEYLGERFIPIIMVTALDEHQGMAKCIQEGADDYLTKPLDAVLLNSKLFAMERIRKLHYLQIEQNRQLQEIQARIDDEQKLAESILNTALSQRKDDIASVTSTVHPAELFSGDLVLQSALDNGDWMVLVNDFTGHGLPAAVGTVPVTETFYTMSRKRLMHGSILKELNYKLKNFLPVNMFMCCAFLHYTAATNEVELWNGGMPRILFKDGQTGKVSKTYESTDVPLGIVDKSEEQFVFQKLTMKPGDALVVYSDGLTEAENLAGEQFGLDRLLATVEASPADEQEKSIVSAWQAFQGQGKQLDDVTLVTAHF